MRVVANRSSGRQGFALAQSAIDRGAQVVLIAGPTHLSTPVGVERVDVRSAQEMRDAVLAQVEGAHVLLMAAAVADFRPSEVKQAKIKRRKGVPQLKFEPTDDILALVCQRRKAQGWPRVLVGFAAESEHLAANARAKREEKDLSLIVANDVSAKDSGFEVDTNKVTLVDEQGGVEELQLMTKVEVAEIVLKRVVGLLA